MVKTQLYPKEAQEKIISELKKGKVGAFPTDTVFGLIGRCDNPEVSSAIFAIKKRTSEKKLPIMISNLDQLSQLVDLSDNDYKLLERLFPGQVTFIFETKKMLSWGEKNSSIAVRMPEDDYLLEVVEALGVPVFLTSANLSGQLNLVNSDQVLQELGGKVDFVVEGKSGSEVASTIIDARRGLKIVRQGSVTLEEILERIQEV